MNQTSVPVPYGNDAAIVEISSQIMKAAGCRLDWSYLALPLGVYPRGIDWALLVLLSVATN